ncbi:MAG: aldo/keto reductase, partial [Cohaesibacteraceae bacterium]|nr:aldo/keto reductase [Cohaesibacteraceae bacterium]
MIQPKTFAVATMNATIDVLIAVRNSTSGSRENFNSRSELSYPLYVLARKHQNHKLELIGASFDFFGQLNYQHQTEESGTAIEETLAVLAELVKAGKIRHIGLSNETPWGVMQFLHLAEQLNLPRVVSIQNPYNLLNRSFEIGLAEIAHRENTGLLAYS